MAPYRGQEREQSSSCLDQLFTLAFAQLTGRDSLRAIVTCLQAMAPKLYHMEFLTIAALYQRRWQIELFLKWIKQHLHIKAFYGTSENAVKTQIWTAISAYVLVAIVRKRLACTLPLYTVLQILSIRLFEKVPLPQLLASFDLSQLDDDATNQLPLFSL